MNGSDNKSLGIIGSAIDAAGFDVMNELLIPTQIINQVKPSIPSMSNNILNTNAESTTKEHDANIDGLFSFLMLL